MRRMLALASVMALAGCTIPAEKPATAPSVSVAAIPSGCKVALPPEQVPWSRQHPDGIDARWIGTVDGEQAELSVFDAQIQADQGQTLVGLYICSAR